MLSPVRKLSKPLLVGFSAWAWSVKSPLAISSVPSPSPWGTLSCVSVVPDSATPWTVACQAPLSMEFSRQEYWSGLPCSLPGHLDPGIEPGSLALEVDSLLSKPPGSPLPGVVGLKVPSLYPRVGSPCHRGLSTQSCPSPSASADIQVW